MSDWQKWPVDKKWAQLLDDEAHIALPLELPTFFRSSAWITARSVVDLGCGNCAHLAGLAEKFPHKDYTGIDIDEKAITAAHKKIAEKKCPSIELSHEDMFTVNGKWDAAIARLLVQHVSNLPGFLEKCKNIIRPGGAIFVIDSDEASWLTVPDLVPLGQFFKSLAEWRIGAGFRRDSAFVLEGIATEHGYEILRAETVLIPTTVGNNKEIYFRIMLNAIDTMSALYDFEWDFAALRKAPLIDSSPFVHIF